MTAKGEGFTLGPHAVVIIHYNLLVQLHDTPDLEVIDHTQDPLFAGLMALRAIHGLYLCYAPDGVVRQRMGERTQIEPDLAGMADAIYPQDLFVRAFAQVDQRRSLLDFGALLRDNTERRDIVFSKQGPARLLAYESFVSGTPDAELQAAIS